MSTVILLPYIRISNAQSMMVLLVVVQDSGTADGEQLHLFVVLLVVVQGTGAVDNSAEEELASPSCTDNNLTLPNESF